MKRDSKISLILGRPILSTTNAHIDVEAGEIRFNINGKEERFAFKPKAAQCSMTSIVENAEEMAQSSLGHSSEEN